MVNKKREKALDNKCPACGAIIKYDPKSGKWACEYCLSEFTLEEMQKHNNASSETNNNATEEIKSNSEGTEYISYKCNNCGAEIIADEQTAATFCVYCGNTAILQSKLSGKFNPDLIIPFKIEKEQAKDALKGLAKGRPLVPKEFTNEKNIEKIKGVYIPFWLYDLEASGELTATGKKIRTWTIGNTHYTETSTYNIERSGCMDFIKVPVDGSTRFDNDMMNSIEPFNYDELEKYNHAYLSGFYAEKYDVESDEAIKDANVRTLNTARDTLLNHNKDGISSIVVTNNGLIVKEKQKYYVLLPVWMVNINYNNELYLFAMNGQTGEFIGNIPLDKNKAIKIGIILFISIVVLIFVISYLVYLGGL